MNNLANKGHQPSSPSSTLTVVTERNQPLTASVYVPENTENEAIKMPL